MSAPVPISGIPPNWMHPDLRRQLADRTRNRVTQRLGKLEHYRVATEARSQAVAEHLQAKRARVESLSRELEDLRQEVVSIEERDTVLRELLVGVSNQVFYQRTIVEESGLLHRSGGAAGSKSPPPIGAAKAAQPDISQCIGTRTGYDATQGRRAAGGGADSSSMLDVHFLHNMDTCLATPAQVGGDADADSIRAFLKRFAPLFGWDAELCCVPPPLLFDEPCLMEREAGGVPCSSPACAYWHHDQLRHLRRALERVADGGDAACVRDTRLCGARKLFAALRTFVRESGAIDQLCCGVAYTLNRIIALGWHVILLQADSGAGVGGRQELRQPLSSDGWPAPVVAAASADGPVPARDDPLALPVQRVTCAEERDAWEVAVVAVQHGSTPADVFTADPTALTWRCMSRILGTTRERRLWLAETGVCLFPTSLHLHVAHLLCLMESGTETSPADCAKACLGAARLLSTQAAAAALTQSQATYSGVAARYVGFLVAMCAVHTASRDAAVAVDLLTEVLGTSPTPNAEDGAAGRGGGYALLPMAQHNLTLLLIALQRTGHLHEAELLPLGAVSDTLLVLSADFPSEPQEATVQRLNTHLVLLNACQRDSMAPAMVDRMRAATQLSLVRAFAQSVQFIEQILHKAAPHSEEAQASLWLAYARSLCVVDGLPSAPKVTAELLEQTDGEASCLLVLLMLWHLQSHATLSASVSATAGKTVSAFLARHGLTREGHLFCAAATRPVAVAPVEWVACHVLAAHAEAEVPLAQWQALAAIPRCHVYGGGGEETDPALLLLMAEVRVAGAAGSTPHFRAALTRCIGFLASAHGQWWSALDAWQEERVIGLPHWVCLSVYRAVPFLLGARSGELTLEWRKTVLEVAAHWHVLHPVLRE